MSRFIQTFCLSLAFLFSNSQSCLAEAPRWYEVELALIGYQDEERITHENWTDILINEPVLEEQASADPAWSWLNWWNSNTVPQGLFNIQKETISANIQLETPFTRTGIAFEDKVERFAKYKNLKLVWSKKWRQPIPEKQFANEKENLVMINLRDTLDFEVGSSATGRGSNQGALDIEVTGDLHLYRSRYLHLVTDLNVQHWQGLNKPSNLDKKAQILPHHKNEVDNIIPSKTSTPLTAINEIPLRAAEIKQSRRMRSNELHYIDHPMLGILVKVTPIMQEEQ